MRLSLSPLRRCRIEAEEILRNLRRNDVGGSQVAAADGRGLLLLENCEVCSRMEFWWQGGEMKPERVLKALSLLPLVRVHSPEY